MKKSFYIPLLAPIVTLCLVGAVSANPKTETKTASKTAQKTVIKTAHGRDFKNKVRFTELNVDRTGNKVEITFNVQARGAILNDSETMYIVPLLTDGTYKWSLPAIAVQGKLAEIASERQVWADEKSSLKPILDDSELVLRDNDPMTYRAEVDWQPWMAGSDLIAEGLAFKAGTRALPNTLILADVLPSSKPATKPAYTPVIAAAPAPMPASASQIHPHHIITPVPEPIILAAVEPAPAPAVLAYIAPETAATAAPTPASAVTPAPATTVAPVVAPVFAPVVAAEQNQEPQVADQLEAILDSFEDLNTPGAAKPLLIVEYAPVVEPFSEFEQERYAPNHKFSVQDNEHAIRVFFKQDGYTIDRMIAMNEYSLYRMKDAIKDVVEVPDKKIKAIVIAGYSSPEGSNRWNEKLAYNRALVVKKHLTKATGLPENKFVIYNGGEDWRTLRMLVEECPDVPFKDDVISILDNEPIWDSNRKTGREFELMKIHGGRPYRWLEENIFPQLRVAQYIKIYSED